MNEVNPCPKCKTTAIPILLRVGDNRGYFVVGCPNCGYVAANPSEARRTVRAARRLWNRRTK